MPGRKIITNKIKCNSCGEVIESKHRHDFVTCKCGAVSVDGGKDYLRRAFKKGPEDYEDLSETVEIKI
jgi:tRNA(Ile2) C34 agmatinyltransferase TiaS